MLHEKADPYSFVVMGCITAYGQEDDSNKIKFNAFFGGGRSTLATSTSAPSKFPTLEMRLGGGVNRKLNGTFELRTRLSIGVKFKRDAYNDGGAIFVGPPLMELDDLSSRRNHYFYEAPVTLHANIKHPTIGFKAGVNYRRFLADDSDVDALTARSDFGLLGGVNYRLKNDIAVGRDYCAGLTNIIISSGSVDSYNYTLHVKNNFAQFTVEYTL